MTWMSLGTDCPLELLEGNAAICTFILAFEAVGRELAEPYSVWPK